MKKYDGEAGGFSPWWSLNGYKCPKQNFNEICSFFADYPDNKIGIVTPIFKKDEDNPDYSKHYLTFEALEDTTFTFTQNALQYSLDDGNTWNTLEAGTSTPTVTAGSKIMWKQVGLIPEEEQGMGRFSSTSNFKVYGNIMSLLYGDDFIGQVDLTGKNWAFASLFSGELKLMDATNLILPATTLSPYCYGYLLSGTSITKSPKLPIATLADYCYADMFNDCRLLTKISELPATSLADSCYSEMFMNCISLNDAPELPATTLAKNCYGAMFHGCTSLTKAPELPATTLADYCYSYMFRECTSLNYIKCLATNISATGCTSNWVQNVSSAGTFVKAASMTSWTTGINGIPSGWVVMNDEDDEDSSSDSSEIDINEVGSVTKDSSGFTITIDDNSLENGTYKMIYEDSTRTSLENVNEITEFTII